MSDMADTFNAMKAQTKAHRAEMLATANTEGWEQLSPYHFRRFFGKQRVDWWPSGGKAQVNGRMVYGHSRVRALIAKLSGNG